MARGRTRSPTNGAAQLISLEDVVVTFPGARALDGFSAHFGPGITVALGRNGAGKSTMCHALAGVIRPESGRLLSSGVPVASGTALRQHRRRTGWLPQAADLPPGMTCREYLTLACWFKDVPPRTRESAIVRSLATVDLADSARRRVRELSGGMQRRLGIAQALVSEPQLLVLDEPTVGLDPEQRSALHAVLVELAESGVTVVVSTHLLEDVGALKGSVVVMDSGRQRFVGSTEEFRALAPGSGVDSWQVAFRAAVSGNAAEDR